MHVAITCLYCKRLWLLVLERGRIAGILQTLYGQICHHSILLETQMHTTGPTVSHFITRNVVYFITCNVAPMYCERHLRNGDTQNWPCNLHLCFYHKRNGDFDYYVIFSCMITHDRHMAEKMNLQYWNIHYLSAYSLNILSSISRPFSPNCCTQVMGLLVNDTRRELNVRQIPPASMCS